MSKQFYEAVGSRIRQVRERAGLSLDQLADAAGTNGTFVGRVERGLQNMSLLTIGRLAVALAVEPSVFFDGVVADPALSARTPRRNARTTPPRRSETP